MHKERLTALSLIIIAAAASRLLPHPENVAPIAAMALFSGAYFARQPLMLAVPFLALLASDLVIGFYSGMWVVYGSFALITGIGMLLRNGRSVQSVFYATLSSSILFFLLTNCVWLTNEQLYPVSWAGQITAYEAAIPFFRNTLLGDLVYSGLLFGGFALMERYINRLQPSRADA